MIKRYNQYINEASNSKNHFKKRVKNYPEMDPNNLDPYGEENWDDDELTPVLRIAEKQNKPYDQITKLDCHDKGLTSLKGIEKLINLKRLDCSDNDLTNLNELENLIHLEKLDCKLNNLTNLNGLENLINLKNLDCKWNSLTSLNGIENLINLKRLNCSYNNLTSLKEIKNLINLIELICINNNFSFFYKQRLNILGLRKNIKLNI